jgi:hypothetical protein
MKKINWKKFDYSYRPLTLKNEVLSVLSCLYFLVLLRILRSRPGLTKNN